MSSAEPTSGSDVRIRPMRPDDVAAVERLTSQSYYELDQRTSPRGASDPSPRSAARGLMWQRRVHHLLGTDPGGCWVAEVDGAVVGTAVSFNRELMWVLASFAVRPDLQGAGIGAQLLAGAPRPRTRRPRAATSWRASTCTPRCSCAGTWSGPRSPSSTGFARARPATST